MTFLKDDLFPNYYTVLGKKAKTVLQKYDIKKGVLGYEVQRQPLI